MLAPGPAPGPGGGGGGCGCGGGGGSGGGGCSYGLVAMAPGPWNPRAQAGTRSGGGGYTGITQVRWNCYAPEYRDPLIDKEYYHKPVSELTQEEKYDQELKKTELIKAAAATETSSVFADPVISKFTNMMMKGGNKVLARSLMAQTLEAVKRKQFEKDHAASAEEQATIERNPYRIFHQALKNCEPVIGLVPFLPGPCTPE
ncbi:28S ribosomal protein S7, mitochondrial [Lemmus lemmus]